MRIYISGAITKDKDYFNHFKRVEKELKKIGFSCINPAKVNAQLPEDTTYEEYMKMSFCLLSLCYVAYFLNGLRIAMEQTRNTDMHLPKDILFYSKR